MPPTVQREAGLTTLETTDWARWLAPRVEAGPGSEAVGGHVAVGGSVVTCTSRAGGSFGAGVVSCTPPVDGNGSGGVALAGTATDPLLRTR